MDKQKEQVSKEQPVNMVPKAVVELKRTTEGLNKSLKDSVDGLPTDPVVAPMVLKSLKNYYDHVTLIINTYETKIMLQKLEQGYKNQ